MILEQLLIKLAAPYEFSLLSWRDAFAWFQSFVSCPLGVNWIGFVLICYGACDSVCSLLFGRIEKYTGRFPLFLMAFLINITLIIVFQVWFLILCKTWKAVFFRVSPPSYFFYENFKRTVFELIKLNTSINI